MTWELVRAFEDIAFFIRMRKVNEVVVCFEAMRTYEYNEGLPGSLPYRFQTLDCEYTADPEWADIFVKGSVKWDGCSSVDFGSSLHACGRKQMTDIGVLFDRLFDMTVELIGHAENLS